MASGGQGTFAFAGHHLHRRGRDKINRPASAFPACVNSKCATGGGHCGEQARERTELRREADFLESRLQRRHAHLNGITIPNFGRSRFTTRFPVKNALPGPVLYGMRCVPTPSNTPSVVAQRILPSDRM